MYDTLCKSPLASPSRMLANKHVLYLYDIVAHETLVCVGVMTYHNYHVCCTSYMYMYTFFYLLVICFIFFYYMIWCKSLKLPVVIARDILHVYICVIEVHGKKCIIYVTRDQRDMSNVIQLWSLERVFYHLIGRWPVTDNILVTTPHRDPTNRYIWDQFNC